VAKRIETDEVRRLVEDGAQLVDVLPRDEFLDEHLPGAVNIPLADIAGAPSALDPRRPTVVYCFDYQCDLSARGAAHLERLGFGEVYDYVASKVAWLADGHPGAGRIRDRDRVGAIARPDVPTVEADACVADLRAVIGDWEVAVVVDDERVVLGDVRRRLLELPDDTALATVMNTAPPTVRPSITRRELAQSMDRNGERQLLVTTLDGNLLGLVRRGDLDAG
jgi:rhodanese-related sulfurtransferase